MEICALFALLAGDPVMVTDHGLVFAGVDAPLIIAGDLIPSETRNLWLAGRHDVPPAQRIAALWSADAPVQAWDLMQRHRIGIGEDMAVYQAMLRWVARQQSDLDWPGGMNQAIMVITADGPASRNTHRRLEGGLRDLRTMLDSMPWPRWAGPLVILTPGATLAGMSSDQNRLARPAMPVIRIPAENDAIDQRQAIARAACDIYWALSFPPADGWPRWLLDGMTGVAEARSQGQGPSPRRMLAHRRQAGTDALRQLLLDRRHDPELATAVCAMLIHSLRRRHLPNLIDMLRNGVDSLSALHIAYGLELDHLVE